MIAALMVLTGIGPYPVSMIGLPGEMSNMAPPTVCLLLLTVGHTALLMLVRQRLDRCLRRPGVWAGVVLGGVRAMPAYLWHLPVMSVAVGLFLLLKVDVPPAGTTLEPFGFSSVPVTTCLVIGWMMQRTAGTLHFGTPMITGTREGGDLPSRHVS